MYPFLFFLSSFSVAALWIKFSHAYPEKNVQQSFSECVYFLNGFVIKDYFRYFRCYGNETKSTDIRKKKNKLTYSFSAFESKNLYFLMRSIKLSSQAIGAMFNAKTFKYHQSIQRYYITPTFLLNKVHSVYSVNIFKEI